MNQGDIVLVPFPFTDQSNSVRRPALVISGSVMNKSQDVILVQITSTQRLDNFSIPFDNRNDVSTPLKLISEIRCNKIVTTDKNLIIKSISKLKQPILTAVIAKIADIMKP